MAKGRSGDGRKGGYETKPGPGPGTGLSRGNGSPVGPIAAAYADNGGRYNANDKNVFLDLGMGALNALVAGDIPMRDASQFVSLVTRLSVERNRTQQWGYFADRAGAGTKTINGNGEPKP